MNKLVETGEFGRGGDRHARVVMEFQGKFLPSFADFAMEKAETLSLTVFIETSELYAKITATGPVATLGILEMSACIAPDDCTVDDWTVQELP